MTTKKELENEVKEAYKNRYGDNAVVKMDELKQVEPNSHFYHTVLYYKDDNGVVRANHDIYAFSDDETNFQWYNTNPTTNIPAKASTTMTFYNQIKNKIDNLTKQGTILYGEILSVNEQTKRARIFIKDANAEGVYIVWMDENGDIHKEKTSFDRIVS